MIEEYAGAEWAGLGPNAQPVEIVCDHDVTDDRPLCTDCSALLRCVLDDVPGLVADLALAHGRQVSFVQHGRLAGDSGSDEEETARLPWSEAASRARSRLLEALAAAGALLQPPCAGGPVALAQQLTARLDDLARHPASPELAARLARAAAKAHAVIDRPPSPWYYGPCPRCGHDIFQERVDPTDAESRVRCDEACGYAEPLAAHRAAQLDAGDDRLMTVAELVGAITAGGEVVTRDQIHGWAKREGLERERQQRPHFVDGRLQARSVWAYRLGEVRKLAAQAEQRRSEAWGGGWD